MPLKGAGGIKINIIDTSKTVSETLKDLRGIFIMWGIEEWEPIPDEDGRGYSVRFLRGKEWTTIHSNLQPAKAQNLRVCFWVIKNMKVWGERGITGAAQGVSFIGGLVPSGKTGDRENFEEACAIVGIDPGASLEEIKRLYQIKVQYAHPDKGGDPERFKRLTKAYEYILKVKGGS